MKCAFIFCSFWSDHIFITYDLMNPLKNDLVLQLLKFIMQIDIKLLLILDLKKNCFEYVLNEQIMDVD